MATTGGDCDEEVFELRMKDAEASKQAGNAALAAGNAKSASFHYKKVYLYLAEYLPADMAASALASASALPPSVPSQGGNEGSKDDDAASGLVGFLQARRRKQQQQQTQNSGAASSEEALRAKADAEAARKQRLYALYGSTLNNLTLVNYKLGRYREGVATATCLLNRVPGFELSPKALLRRGYCYVALQEPLLAEVNANELEKLVNLAAERCSASGDGSTAAADLKERDGDQGGCHAPPAPSPASSPAGEAVIEGLGGMTVAAVAAMKGEVASLRSAIEALKKSSDEKEKKLYRKMFAAA